MVFYILYGDIIFIYLILYFFEKYEPKIKKTLRYIMIQH